MRGSYTLCVFMPVMAKLFARQVFYKPFNMPATLSVYHGYALFSTTPQYRNATPAIHNIH
jgi:hypothetical protein